jgi:lysophospholipase L1-like esterase
MIHFRVSFTNPLESKSDPLARARLATRHFCALACLLFASAALAVNMDDDRRWVSAWQGSPTPGQTFDPPSCPSDAGLNSQTVRNLVFISAGGQSVRARISNAYGNNPLLVGAASIAISASGANTVAGSIHKLRFGGKDSILVAAGGEAVSDPVPMTVQALQILAISIYLPRSTGPATQHYFALQENFIAAGDQSSSSDGSGYSQLISCWMFLSGVDVSVSSHVMGALITVGDSVTDGFASTSDSNHRYPDYLARRLASRSGITMSVSNSGIAGYELLAFQPDILLFGYPSPSRLARDVLTQAGVRAVILLQGNVDIGAFSARAEDLAAADQQIILQTHMAGLKIYGGTLTPFGGSNPGYGGNFGTPYGNHERAKLNDWIRTSGAFDGVIHFDSAVQDPANPTNLLPAYDSGDHVHPNDSGYEAMGNAVNVEAIISAGH